MKNFHTTESMSVNAAGQARRVFAVTATILAGMALLVFSAGKLQAQSVSHSTANITGTASYFFYTHMLSQTEKKDIKYIIVRASNGDIKTMFNACDVCYYAYKGYSQNGKEMRCNNCGTRFLIDTLGGANTSGTCNPGYLPHRIEGDMVVIDHSSLILGAYLFKSETVTSIGEPESSPSDISIRQSGSELTVLLPNEAHRSFSTFTIDGRYLGSHDDASRIVHLPIDNLIPGAYLLMVRDAQTLTSKKFLVY